MDYIIDALKQNGFKPESRREAGFVQDLKDSGFVYFNKETNMFKLKDETVICETPDEITLSIKPKINYLGLFPNVDNFNTSLNSVRVKHVMLEFLGGAEDAEKRVQELIKGHKLGQQYSLTALGFGKSSTNEGFKLEVPEELEDLMYKGNRVCYMTTGLSKTGKERDTKQLDFVGVRPAKILFRLGISTTFGVFYDMEDYINAGNVKVIDKALLK